MKNDFLFADTSTADAIMEAYTARRNYVVLSENESFDKQFISCEAMGGDRDRLIFSAPFDGILVIGEGGIVKALATHSDIMFFTFQPDDAYLRIVAKDDNMQIYLNSLVRYNGIDIHLKVNLKAEKNTQFSWLFRPGVFVVPLLLALAERKLIIQ